MTVRVFIIPTVGIALLLLAGGCSGGSSKTIPQEGIVTLDGEPIDGAQVTFTPKQGDGRPASGRTGGDGVFKLTTSNTGDGAVPGDYLVTISKTTTDSGDNNQLTNMDDKARAAMMSKMMAGTTDQTGRSQLKAKQKDALPPSYADPLKSGLKATVPTSGRIKFELRKVGG